MSSPQLVVIYCAWLDGYCYGEMDTCMISPGLDRDIRLDDCIRVDPTPEWDRYMQSILKLLHIKQSNGKYIPIKGPITFVNMIKIKNTGYLMPEIQIKERQDPEFYLPYMSSSPRKPQQCIAPPKPKEVYTFPPVPVVKRVHIACPSPAKPAVPVRQRRDSCDSTRAVRADLNRTQNLHGTRGRSDSCDSTGAVHHFDTK